MRNDQRCFLQWFVLLLGYIAIASVSWHYGLPQAIFRTDTTYMTSVIAAIFAIAVTYVGLSSWWFGVNDVDVGRVRIDAVRDAWADIGLAHKASYVVTLLGLLGTVIGLMHQVQAMATVQPDDLMPFLATVSSALGTAFYATACGIVASIGIISMAANLEYFADRS